MIPEGLRILIAIPLMALVPAGLGAALALLVIHGGDKDDEE